MKLDLFEFARLGGEASGELALARMHRIDTPDRTGAVSWKAAGATGNRLGALQLDLDIDGRIALVCQRCLQEMTHTLAIRSHFLIAHDEGAATALDDDAWDVIVGAADYELDALIEDEVILSLPIAPRHEACPGEHAYPPHRKEKPSPFAVLEPLRTAPRVKSGGDGR